MHDIFRLTTESDGWLLQASSDTLLGLTLVWLLSCMFLGDRRK